MEYERDGTLLFWLEGHDATRFERVMALLRDMVPVAEREWWPSLGLWVIDAGWDEELQEILEEHLEPGDILVRGVPLDAGDEDEWPEHPRQPVPGVGRHGWIDLDVSPTVPDRQRLGRLILPAWGTSDFGE
jgi:hypothetical protein